MSLQVSNPKLKFLFDENVDKRLERFLKQDGIDVISKPKRLSNGKLAEFSKSEQRILVTNDSDFIGHTKDKIYSVVLLRIPQRKIDSLVISFSKLIKEIKPDEFEGNLIRLYENRFETSGIPSTE